MDFRFFYPQIFHKTDIVTLTDDEHHHLSRVLRIKENETVELINGKGLLAQALVVKIEKNKTILNVLDVFEEKKDPFFITAAIALMRASKLEYILEKGTELGADKFVLYPADQSTQETLSKEKIQRLENIILSATKQSRRLFLPQLEIGVSLDEILHRSGTFYFGDLKNTKEKKLPPLEKETTFITGPESGFSKNEQKLLEEKTHGVFLNTNVLRAETAPMVFLSLFGIQRSS